MGTLLNFKHDKETTNFFANLLLLFCRLAYVFILYYSKVKAKALIAQKSLIVHARTQKLFITYFASTSGGRPSASPPLVRRARPTTQKLLLQFHLHHQIFPLLKLKTNLYSLIFIQI